MSNLQKRTPIYGYSDGDSETVPCSWEGCSVSVRTQWPSSSNHAVRGWPPSSNSALYKRPFFFHVTAVTDGNIREKASCTWTGALRTVRLHPKRIEPRNNMISVVIIFFICFNKDADGTSGILQNEDRWGLRSTNRPTGYSLISAEYLPLIGLFIIFVCCPFD